MGRRGETIQSDILSILRRRGGPVSAYDVLDDLRPANPKIAPTTIYRALAALTDRGKVHRLESLNAFMACRCGDHEHASILSICDDCGTVEENIAPELLERLSKVIGSTGFAPLRHVIEVHGTCSACNSGQDQT